MATYQGLAVSGTYKQRTISKTGKKLTAKGQRTARKNDLKALAKGRLGKNQMAARDVGIKGSRSKGGAIGKERSGARAAGFGGG